MDFAWSSLKTTYQDGRIDATIWRGEDSKPNMSRLITMNIPLDEDDVGISQELEILIWADGNFESASHRATLFSRLIDEHCAMVL